MKYWGDPLPDETSVHWQIPFREIQGLQTIVSQMPATKKCTLNAFADMSGTAYGDVAYLLWPRDGGLEVCLIAAKSRVAPLRQTT